MQILLDLIVLLGSLPLQLALLVISFDKVLNDGSRLPKSEVIVVGVADGGDSAIGVDLNIPLLLGGSRNGLLIGKAELVQKNLDLERIGTAVDKC